MATSELIQIQTVSAAPAPKPRWLRAKAPMGEQYHELKKLARGLDLNTVCESAHCPNIGECWNHRTATFMLLGTFAPGVRFLRRAEGTSRGYRLR